MVAPPRFELGSPGIFSDPEPGIPSPPGKLAARLREDISATGLFRGFVGWDSFSLFTF